MPLQALQRQVIFSQQLQKSRKYSIVIGDGFKGFLYRKICI